MPMPFSPLVLGGAGWGTMAERLRTAGIALEVKAMANPENLFAW
jgi:hypothetical protein